MTKKKPVISPKDAADLLKKTADGAKAAADGIKALERITKRLLGKRGDYSGPN
jgi:hypothetical protein